MEYEIDHSDLTAGTRRSATLFDLLEHARVSFSELGPCVGDDSLPPPEINVGPCVGDDD